MEWDKDQLYTILFNQLQSLFWLDYSEKEKIKFCVENRKWGVIKNLEKNFSSIQNKYYNNQGVVIFSSLHTSQYTFFLYRLANILFRQEEDKSLCDRLYELSKIISGMDLYYEVDMPEIFFFDHPMGSVIGRARYRNFFSFSQGCTVGQNNGVYPEFGERVVMMSDSKVIGKCKIGDNVVISANTYIKDTDIPDNCIVFGNTPSLVIKSGQRDRVESIIKNIFAV